MHRLVAKKVNSKLSLVYFRTSTRLNWKAVVSLYLDILANIICYSGYVPYHTIRTQSKFLGELVSRNVQRYVGYHRRCVGRRVEEGRTRVVGSLPGGCNAENGLTQSRCVGLDDSVDGFGTVVHPTKLRLESIGSVVFQRASREDRVIHLYHARHVDGTVGIRF